MPEYTKNRLNLVNNIDVLWDILGEAGQDLEIESLILVLNALDECYKSGFWHLVRILKYNLQKEKDKLCKIKFLLMSRLYNQIMSKF